MVSHTDAGTAKFSGTGRREFSESGTTKFTWTCPICGDSATRLAAREQAEYVALNALRSHVRSSTGDGHGSEYGFPPAFDPESLDDAVELAEL